MLHSHAGVIQHWQAFVLWLALRMDWLGLFLFFFFKTFVCFPFLPLSQPFSNPHAEMTFLNGTV